MTQTVGADRFVEIRDATKTFVTPEGKTFNALDGLSLDVFENEFVTLLGPSGCGKTTLLRTLSGLEDLDSGDIRIDGRPMAGVPAHRRPVNTVFQSYALFPHLTVGRNVAYSLDVAGVSRRERDKRVADALDLVGLSGMERRKPRQLSGGQQQRVALARAIVGNPRLLLLDEPLAALDRGLRQTMQIELKTIQSELGISFVFVTHDQEEALTMSDRVVVMNGGRIEQIGTPSEVYSHPFSPFVARFVGESNLFPGVYETRDDGVVAFTTDTGQTLPTCPPVPPAGRRDGMLLIRPEWLSLQRDGGPDDDDRYGDLTAALKRVVFQGTDYQLICELPCGTPLRAFIREAHDPDVKHLSPGEPVTFRYPLSAPVLLEREAAA